MAEERTHSYQWPEGTVIRRIDVRQQKNGWAVAYLYADPSEALKSKRQDIRAAIRLKGWGTLSDSRSGEFVLRVTGLRSGGDLIGMLEEQGYIVGKPLIAEFDNEVAKPKNLWEAITSRSLRASGIFATVGNAMSTASGFHRMTDPRQKKTLGQIGLGASFAAADLPLALVDEQDNSRQLNLLLKKLRTHYEKDGIEIPKNASIYVETSDEGKTLGERTQDFIHDYANQIKCGFEVVASLFSMKAGFDQLHAAGKGGQGWRWSKLHDKTRAGLIFGPGFLASLLIPEKKFDQDKYAQAGFFEKIWMRVQANPLMVGGLLGYSNTFFTYKSAMGERKAEMAKPAGQRTHFYRWDYAIPTDMIAANGLYAVSKKTVGGDIKSEAMVKDAYRIAAQIINKQPGEMRERALESTARFFGERMEIREHYAEARERLAKELDSQRANPWFELQGLAPYRPRTAVTRDDELSASSIDEPTTKVISPVKEHAAPSPAIATPQVG